MDTQVTVAIIAGVFGAFITPFTAQVIIPAFQRKPKEKLPNKGTTSPKTLIQSVLGGLIGVLLGYFLIGQLMVLPCPPLAPTSVEIKLPPAGSKITQLITVEGSACHIADNEELWLFVIPEGVTAYYPQMGPIVVSANGSWVASAYVGLNDPVDSGRGFYLVTALADREGGAAIRAYFSQAGPDFKGLEPLPQGIRLMNQVKVIRK